MIKIAFCLFDRSNKFRLFHDVRLYTLDRRDYPYFLKLHDAPRLTEKRHLTPIESNKNWITANLFGSISFINAPVRCMFTPLEHKDL